MAPDRGHYDSDPAVLGRTLKANSKAVTIVGVMPPVLRFPDNVDLWVPRAQLPPETLTGELEEIVAAGGVDNRYSVFVDFFGGSCCHAGLSIEQSERVRVITGVNLPMLLAFLYKRDEVDFEKLPDELTARGHDSIRFVEAERL